MKKLLAVALVMASGAAQAALVDRGGGFIYDDVLDITWLQDANYARTTGYDDDGWMDWYEAMDWAENLSVYDSMRDVIWDDWRLPTTMQPDPGCSELIGIHAFIAADCTGSELAYLTSAYGIESYRPSPGPFTNLTDNYWYGTENAANTDEVWIMDFETPDHYTYRKTASTDSRIAAWAVMDGDVGASVVPIPAAVWLFASGLGLLGWFRRKV